jgi:hypothetical protein
MEGKIMNALKKTAIIDGVLVIAPAKFGIERGNFPDEYIFIFLRPVARWNN